MMHLTEFSFLFLWKCFKISLQFCFVLRLLIIFYFLLTFIIFTQESAVSPVAVIFRLSFSCWMLLTLTLFFATICWSLMFRGKVFLNLLCLRSVESFESCLDIFYQFAVILANYFLQLILIILSLNIAFSLFFLLCHFLQLCVYWIFSLCPIIPLNISHICTYMYLGVCLLSIFQVTYCLLKQA